MGWTVWGSNPDGSEILCTHPDLPWGSPNPPYDGYWIIPGVKRLGCGIHSPPSSAEVKGRVQLYLYSPSGPSWPVLGWTQLFMYCVEKWIVLVVPQAVNFAFVVRNFARNIPSNVTSKLTFCIKRNLYVVVCLLWEVYSWSRADWIVKIRLLGPLQFICCSTSN